MPRRHLSRDEMLRAVGMLQVGQRQVDVARALRTTQGVISRLWFRFRMTGQVGERHQGRHRKTTAAQDRYLHLTARRTATQTAVELRNRLQEIHGVEVSSQTVINRLREVNLRSRRPLRCQPLTRGNRTARLNWAQEHVRWENEQWSRVLFTDESRFGIHPDSRRVRVWRAPGRNNRLRDVQEVHRFKGGTLMVWGGIAIGRRTPLVLVDGNLNAVRYRDQILEMFVLPFAAEAGENFIFQQDNARPHTAGLVRNFLQEHNVTVLPWPAQSPDMNPIEHAWDMLQRRIQRGGVVHNNQRELFAALQQAWEDIPQEEFDNLILSMQRRCRALVNNRGGHTMY